ncbi:MAG: carboxypeptidase regulatory-like domain-containing protein [Methyloglobulus sp.]|nr:carboxypeptidase regulatory-like domain-containing protein [Methyloglobulus sp.]
MSKQHMKSRVLAARYNKTLQWPYFIIALMIGFITVGNQGIANGAAGPGGIIEGSIDYPATSDFTLEDSHYSPGIPGVTVYAKNTSTLAESPRVVTDSKGAFVIPNQLAGNYYLCWTGGPPGITAGCDTIKPFDVINQVSVRYIPGVPTPNPAAAVLGGFVTLPSAVPPFAEHATCLHSDPFFGIDQTAKVELLNSSGVTIASARANTDGRYIIGLTNPVPGANYRLKASCGNSKVVVTAAFGAVGTYLKQDIQLPANKTPSISKMIAKFQGQPRPVSGVPLGKTVRVTVTAADGDATDTLHYRWQATAGLVLALDSPTVWWTLPATGKGLHFLYVDVDDHKGGHKSQRVAISTDGGVVVATSPVAPVSLPSDNFPEADRFLSYRGIDTRKSACEYYKALHAVVACNANGNPIGPTLTFTQWLTRNDIGAPNGPAKPGEIKAAFRNVADLNLVRNHHARKVNANRISYYVCNHGLATGALPIGNLVACVAMEYSIINGVNNNKPFVQFYTFGPTGKLYLSVNLDTRGEKFMPGTCVVCHGGDNYFHHFPDKGVSSRDANIGAYMLPFDLDNFEFDSSPQFTKAAQQNAVRKLNLLIKQTAPTQVAKQLINGWYPGGVGLQKIDFVPPGWDETLDTSLPALSRGDTFNTSDLYLKVVKNSCRGCHVAMGTKLGLDFNRYQQLVQKDAVGNPVIDPVTNLPIPINDPTTAPDDRVGDFVSGHADEIFGQFNEIGQNNALHAYSTVCSEFGNGLPTWNIFDNTIESGKTMPNALQTFNRFWQNSEQIGLLDLFIKREVFDTLELNPSNHCDPAFRPVWAAP